MRCSRSRRALSARISIWASFAAALCAGRLTASAQNGDVIAEVVANGSGCPDGTWHAEIAADGSTFTLTFDEYRATVAPQAALDVQSCQLAIRLNATQSKSYAVASFSYEGRVVLSAGVRGKFTSSYYFQGSPDEGRRAQDEEFVGPRQEQFQLLDAIDLEDLDWSACGPQRDLNVQTNIVLKNNPDATGSGAMYLSSVDGPGRVVVRIAARDC